MGFIMGFIMGSIMRFIMGFNGIEWDLKSTICSLGLYEHGYTECEDLETFISFKSCRNGRLDWRQRCTILWFHVLPHKKQTGRIVSEILSSQN